MSTCRSTSSSPGSARPVSRSRASRTPVRGCEGSRPHASCITSRTPTRTACAWSMSRDLAARARSASCAVLRTSTSATWSCTRRSEPSSLAWCSRPGASAARSQRACSPPRENWDSAMTTPGSSSWSQTRPSGSPWRSSSRSVSPSSRSRSNRIAATCSRSEGSHGTSRRSSGRSCAARSSWPRHPRPRAPR